MSRTTVTAGDLRRLATVDSKSLFRDADTLVLSEEGITIVPFKFVADALSGHNKFVHRLLLSRSELADSGIEAGAKPKTFDGSDLDARFADIAAVLNEAIAETTESEK
jgi:hypothetical protein